MSGNSWLSVDTCRWTSGQTIWVVAEGHFFTPTRIPFGWPGVQSGKQELASGDCVCAGEQMVDSGKELAQPPSHPLPAHSCTQCLLPSFWNSPGRSHLWCCAFSSEALQLPLQLIINLIFSRKFLFLLNNVPTPSDPPQPLGLYFYFCIYSIISVGFRGEEGYTVVCP